MKGVAKYKEEGEGSRRLYTKEISVKLHRTGLLGALEVRQGFKECNKS